MQTLRKWRAKKEDEQKNPKYWLDLTDGGEVTWLMSNIPLLNMHNVGWKLHISLESSDRRNLKCAWDIASTLCKGYGIRTAKIFNTSDEFLEKNKGREITIYLEGSSLNEESMLKFCLNLEISLAARKVIPGPNQRKAPADKRIDGSRYLSFRNDERLLTAADKVNIPRVQKIAEQMDTAGLSLDEIQAYVQQAGYTLEDIHPKRAFYVSQEEACSRANPEQGIYSWNPYHFPDKFGLETMSVSEAYPNIESKAEQQPRENPERGNIRAPQRQSNST